MSKAFTKDDDAAAAPRFVRSRAPLPQGTPNYVTPRGLTALRDERVRLDAERSRWEAADDPAPVAAVTARIADLDARIGGAMVVPPPAPAHRDTVRFGALVTVERQAEAEAEAGTGAPADADRRYQIVGVDEADAAAGRIAFTAPLARALLGRHVGDTVQVKTAQGRESWLIRAVDYDDPPA